MIYKISKSFLNEKLPLGVGATIIQSIKIIKNSFIDAGSVVTKNINVVGKYFGVPGRKIK